MYKPVTARIVAEVTLKRWLQTYGIPKLQLSTLLPVSLIIFPLFKKNRFLSFKVRNLKNIPHLELSASKSFTPHLSNCVNYDLLQEGISLMKVEH